MGEQEHKHLIQDYDNGAQDVSHGQMKEKKAMAKDKAPRDNEE